MTFTERINLDIKNAMLAREKEKLAALRDIKSKLLLEATSGADAGVSEETAIKICMKILQLKNYFKLRLSRRICQKCSPKMKFVPKYKLPSSKQVQMAHKIWAK